MKLIFSFFFVCIFSTPASPRKAAFHLFFKDSDSRPKFERILTVKESNVVGQVFKKFNSEIDVFKVVIDTPEVLQAAINEKTSFPQKVADMISEEIANFDGVIDYLVISDHSLDRSLFSNNFFSQSETVFEHAGSFSENSVSPSLQKFLTPLKSKLSREPKIIFNSCKTLQGRDLQIKKRLQRFIRFLGVKDALIFGSYGTLISQTYDYPELFFYRNLKKTDHLFATILTITILTVLEDHSFDIYNPLASLLNKGIDTALSFIFSLFTSRALKLIIQSVASEHIREGRLFAFKNGALSYRTDSSPRILLLDPVLKGYSQEKICNIFLSN